MKKKRFYIRTGILLVLLAALGYTLYSAVFQNTESVAVGEKAPIFSLEDVDGNRLKLDELKGKGVFLNFWGTWCEPCKREFPYMANQYKVFKRPAALVMQSSGPPLAEHLARLGKHRQRSRAETRPSRLHARSG